MRLRVLIVEDSEDDALLLSRELARAGHEVTSHRVEDLESLRKALAEDTWDAVLADYSLPHFSGLAALEAVRQTGLDLPFIMVSGTITDEMAVRAMKAGAHDYVMKGSVVRLAPALEREIHDASVRRSEREAQQAAETARRAAEKTKAEHDELRLAHAALELAARLRQALISVNEDLVSTLDLDEVLNRALLKGAEAVGADMAVLELRGQGGWIIQEIWGLPADLRQLVLGEHEAPLAAHAMREHKAFLVADAEHDARLHSAAQRRYRMASALVVPLFAGDQVTGVILFGHSNRPDFFENAHLEFARNLSASIVLALENARLYQEQRSLVRRLEQILLDIPQQLPGVEFGHLYRSATREARVGGDFYDVFEAKHGQIGLLIGDVSGHGIEAARVATLVKDTVHAFAHQFRRPHLVLRETNRLLVEKKVPGFVTVFLAFLSPPTGEMVYSAAGHPAPLLVEEGHVGQLRSYQPPLGVFIDAGYRDTTVVIKEGSVLLLYTDGITDARRNGELFGEARLMSALESSQRSQRVQGLPSVLLDQVLAFSDGVLEDDVAMLAVHYMRNETTVEAGGVAQEPSGS